MFYKYSRVAAFVGDTFKKRYKILSLRTTSKGVNSVFRVECEMINQRNISVFSCEKTMMFPFTVAPSEVEVPSSFFEKDDSFLSHLITEAEALSKLGSQTLSSVRPGQLILHNLVRPISHSYSMQVATFSNIYL